MTPDQQKALENKLSEFERYRRKLHRAHRVLKTLTWPLRVGYIIGFILLVAGAILPFLMPIVLPLVGIAAGLFVLELILINWVFRDPEGRFFTRYQEEIKPFLFTTLLPGVTYEPNKHVSVTAATGSRLFGHKIERSSGQDQVDGELAGIRFRFSGLRLKQPKSFLRSLGEGIAQFPLEVLFTIFVDDYDEAGVGDDGEELVTVFNGGFAIFSLPSKERGSLILQGRSNKWMKVFRKTYGQGRQEGVTGDSSFDDAFRIYGSEGIAINEVLPQPLRSKLVSLQKNKAPQMGVSVVDGHLYIALPWKGEWLRVFFDRPLPDASYFLKHLAYMEQFQEIAEALEGKPSADEHSRYMPK